MEYLNSPAAPITALSAALLKGGCPLLGCSTATGLGRPGVRPVVPAPGRRGGERSALTCSMGWLGHWFGHFSAFYAAYGGWALAALLLLENAGLPLPGEVALFYAAYLSREGRFLPWPLVIAIAAVACTLGDNLGYWIGREAGEGFRRWLRLTPGRTGLAQRFFDRFGGATVFFARFISGLRIIAGPAAGLSRMRWRTFLPYNAAGAVAWSCLITAAGYLTGRHLNRLLHTAGRVELVLIAAAVAAFFYGLHKMEKAGEQRIFPPAGPAASPPPEPKKTPHSHFPR